MKGCTSSVVGSDPQPAAMRLHNGTADGQPHAAALGLGGEEGRKDDGRSAATEFQKLLDHRGLVSTDVIGALAHSQLARAQTLMGDDAAARKLDEDFLTLWKNADADIPIYQQAKAEYARLGRK